MKRNVLSLFALVAAIALSSFTVTKTLTKYFVYQSGSHNVRTNYAETEIAQSQEDGNQSLAWIKIEEFDNVITDGDFGSAFESMDVVSPTLNSLNDDSEGSITQTGLRVNTLEKRD